MARPTKLTPQVQEKIVKFIRNGAYYENAARAAGITYMTFRTWMRAGQAARAGKFFEFSYAIGLAEAELEVELVGRWNKFCMGTDCDWRGIMGFLARRFPERWSSQAREIRLLVKRVRELEREFLKGPEPLFTPPVAENPIPQPPSP
jgi:predicted trehalose synthase